FGNESMNTSPSPRMLPPASKREQTPLADRQPGSDGPKKAAGGGALGLWVLWMLFIEPWSGVDFGAAFDAPASRTAATATSGTSPSKTPSLRGRRCFIGELLSEESLELTDVLGLRPANQPRRKSRSAHVPLATST